MSLRLRTLAFAAAIAGASIVLGAFAAAGAQDRRTPRSGLPVSLVGNVVRTRYDGCGQAWSADEATSAFRLEVERRGRATLHVESRIRFESGGARRLLGGGGPYRSTHEETRVLRWSGRATHARRGAVTIELDSLVSTIERLGPGGELVGPATTPEPATLACVRGPHDVRASERPLDPTADVPIARRDLFECRFVVDDPRHGVAPRPVYDLVTIRFFLSEGETVTTEASYTPYLSATAEHIVIRTGAGRP